MSPLMPAKGSMWRSFIIRGRGVGMIGKEFQRWLAKAIMHGSF
jgi:hypothetical protein